MNFRIRTTPLHDIKYYFIFPIILEHNTTVRNNIHDSRKAQIKCKLLTGTYIPQANRAAYNQYSVNPTCKLCNTAPGAETRQHFVGECTFFNEERKIYMIEKLEASPILSDQYIQSTKPS